MNRSSRVPGTLAPSAKAAKAAGGRKGRGRRPASIADVWAGFQAAALLTALFVLAVPAAAQRGEGRGRRSPELRPCDEHWDHGRRRQARVCYMNLIDQVADGAAKAEAFWGLGNFKQANDLFRQAVEAEPDDPDLRVRWGYLFLETHSQGQALKLFDEALKIDEAGLTARLGKASVLSRRFEGKAREWVSEVIQADPDLVEAYVLLAAMDIEENKIDDAAKVLDQGLEKAEKSGQSPLELYSLKAAIDLLQGAEGSPWIQKALERNPSYGRVFADVAHFYVITRRYREAGDLYRKAVDRDPQLWSAHADLAVNLLREGEEDEAARHLELAYRGDPYSAKTVNTLRLLDSFENFKTFSNLDTPLPDEPGALDDSFEKPTVIVKLHKDEADVLRPYVIELAELSLETFRAKYQFTPKKPVRIELYPDHDDFGVRTMGLPGVGLLGVTFGHVVAMDSPSGRSPGSFHWGTTLWHELAHVITLEATNHLVPRWYSEGISVYEEWAADESWGDRISPDVIEALKKDKFLPVAELDSGFIRPQYPKQIAVSYFQAGLVCRFIAEKWGFSKLVELLDGFGEGRSTADNIAAVVEISSEEFDEQFAAYVKDRYGELLEKFPEWRKLLKKALEAARAKKWDEVIEPAVAARDIYPEYVEGGNAYTLLADAYLEKGDKAAAVEQLQRYRQAGGRSPARIKRLATLLEEMNRRPEAIAALDALLYIAPGDEELHRPLGEWLLAEERYEDALQQFETVIALGPIDPAAAHFQLARTYHKMEDRKKTRRHLLLALEAAPSYRPAQKLLLELRR